MKKVNTKRKYSVPAIDKMNTIFLYLQQLGKPADLANMSRETKIPKTTCMHILNTLVNHGYIFQENGRSVFSLGIKLFSLGQSVEHTLSWTKVLESQLLAFSEKIGEGVKISALIDDQVTVIAKAESILPMRISLSPGMVFPLHAGAASKVLLSQLDAAEQKKLIKFPLKKYTPNTIKTKKDLQNEILKIKKQGYGVDNEEFQEGVMAVAVPLLLPENRAALSIPFTRPSKKVASKIKILQHELKKEKKLMEKSLSGLKSTEKMIVN